ncbi:hypothetical protein MUN81_10945 [Hymenobacter sp. 5317J-9]|uniref:hypothetical protein n=1 Tax=Hymenobacter sp. 5317J-9 TaxID=2932250 RepID=UPI001FD63722|nr:hypothetical protein [Hymenobacter sp. 5317J-9]UOQ99994.1 hypothetical protein MUN81_10945 [Hymenobacter sp. 5317J-9]
MARVNSFLLGAALLLGTSAALTACSDTCTGSIETTVLYAKPGPKGVGRRIYVDVVNKPELGIKQTLLYEGKEFGTFSHVVIISDPTNRYASNRSICFSQYRVAPAETDGDLAEQGIPNISVSE